jgi:hypothetical protein
MRLLPLAAILATLALAAPAYAQTTTVGSPQVITDPTGQVSTSQSTTTPSPPPTPTNTNTNSNTQIDTGDSTPPPLHVTSQLIGQRHSSSTDASSPATASSPPATSAPSAPAADPAPAPQQPTASATNAKQLPFTGIAAWEIALLGLALIAAGATLWRLGEQH